MTSGDPAKSGNTLSGGRFIALIPARAGSKGLPGKNWLEIEGQSLVAKAITSAHDSGAISEVYVSSDDPRAVIDCTRLGAVNVVRSPQAATDESTAADVVRDFLRQVDPAQWNDDPFVVYLQPTSPLRTAAHVFQAIRLLSATTAQACVSVVRTKVSPYKYVTLDESGLIKSLFGDNIATSNRQSLPETYVPNGALYVFRISNFLAIGDFPLSGAVPFVMSEQDSLDVDNLEDWNQFLKRVSENG